MPPSPREVAAAPPLTEGVRRINKFEIRKDRVRRPVFSYALPPFRTEPRVFLPRCQSKAQRSGFELEATSRNTGEEIRLRISEHCVSYEELVTRTGFEPMLKA